MVRRLKPEIVAEIRLVFITISVGLLTLAAMLVYLDFLGQSAGMSVSQFQVLRIIDSCERDVRPKLIAEVCSQENNSSIEIVQCVFDYFQARFSYEYETELSGFDDTLDGTDCKGATVFYCSVLRNLDMSCHPGGVEGHVFATAQFPEGYCNLDQTSVDCYIWDTTQDEGIDMTDDDTAPEINLTYDQIT